MSHEDRFEEPVEGFVTVPHDSPPSANRGFGPLGMHDGADHDGQGVVEQLLLVDRV